MIDTVALTIKDDEYQNLNRIRFQQEVGAGKNPYKKYVYNPNIEKEGYKPRLTIYDRFGVLSLRIELSAPKLLFGNNFDELIEKDFEDIIYKLSMSLGSMGIIVKSDALRNAEISKIDYSKNFIFTDGISSSLIINELNKVDVSAKLDQTYKNFRNDGHLLAYHAKSYEICFYDKRKDLEQARKYGDSRAIENDNSIQLDLFDNTTADPFEVLRFEYRLNERRKMKKILADCGTETDLTFKSLFKEQIAKKVLISIWKLFQDNFDLTVHDASDPMTILEAVSRAKPESSLLKTLAYAKAFEIAASDAGGLTRFKNFIYRHSDYRSWYRIKSQLKGIKLLPHKSKFEALVQVGKQLEQFEPTKLKDYPQFENLQCKQ